MIVLTRADQRFPDEGTLPPPLTWDYAVRYRKPGGHYAVDSGRDLAVCTCANGHTLRLTGKNHRVADDGTVSPSYVCVHAGCTFHEFVRLEGWDASHAYEEVEL